MNTTLTLWNIHSWLDKKEIAHLYTIEENTGAFSGIYLKADDIDPAQYAILTDEPLNTQYKSVLSFQNSRIYFRYLPASEAINVLQEMYSNYLQWQKKMVRANLAHLKTDKLLTMIAEYFPFPLVLFENGRIIAASPGYERTAQKIVEQVCNLNVEQLRNIYDSLTGFACSDDPEFFILPEQSGFVTLKLSQTHQNLRLLSPVPEQKPSGGDLHILKIAASLLSQNMQGNQTGQATTSNGSQIDLSVLFPDPIPSEAVCYDISKQLQWGLSDRFLVYCLSINDPSRLLFLEMTEALLKTKLPGYLSLLYEAKLYLFGNADKGAPVLTDTDLADWLPTEILSVGQSTLQRGIQYLPVLIRQAEQAAATAEQNGKFFVHAQMISTQAVLRQFYASKRLQSLVHPAIKLLHEEDLNNRNSFGYLSTLEAYLNTGGNISAASKKLNIHRNSFVNRLERIREVSGLALTDPEELEALLLSLIIFQDYDTESGRY